MYMKQDPSIHILRDNKTWAMNTQYKVRKKKKNRDGYAQMQKMQDASWNETER